MQVHVARLFMMDLSHYVNDNGFLKISVKTNSPKAEIKGFDEVKGAVKVNIRAPPIEGRANAEVIRLFSKLLKKKVEIKTGKSSKEKLLRVF